MKAEYEVIKLLIFEVVKRTIEISSTIFWNGLYITRERRIGRLKLVKVKVVYCCFTKYFGHWFAYNMAEKKGRVFCKPGWITLFSVYDYWIMEKFKITVVRLSLGVILIASVHVCLCAEQNSHVEEFHMVQGIRLLLGLTHSYHFFLGQFFYY